MRFEAKLPDDSVNVSPGSPAREALILIGGAAGLVLALTVVVALLLELLIPMLPPTTEVRLFSTLPESFGDDEPGSPTDLRTERVQALLDRLVMRWSDTPYPGFQIQVATQSEVNAFALPGGIIVVTSGLLDRVESENELAFVLGHELGHFAGRDHLRGIGRQVALAIAGRLIGLGRDQTQGLTGILGTLAARGFDRQQESRADVFGLRLVVAEYGHAGGIREVFERVLASGLPGDTTEVPPSKSRDQTDREATVLRGLSPYWSTHPLSAARIRALEDRIRSEGFAAAGGQVRWPFEGTRVGDP
ncbi:M48 family metallopeptidase [Myxococcota bacterium]|nr:M48 family metallopeptidase [Myxococcota bacterium]